MYALLLFWKMEKLMHVNINDCTNKTCYEIDQITNETENIKRKYFDR